MVHAVGVANHLILLAAILDGVGNLILCTEALLAKKLPTFPKPVLLLIDDEQSLVETLSVLLKNEGFDVQSALTGEEALKIFSDKEPDIVLTDVRMPKMTGIDVLEAIREKKPDTPVVLMTAQASLNTAIQAVNLGATHYVQKPFKNEVTKKT